MYSDHDGIADLVKVKPETARITMETSMPCLKNNVIIQRAPFAG